jgi:hypothetical protein
MSRPRSLVIPSNPIGSLLLDILLLFSGSGSDRVTTRAMLEGLAGLGDRPWLHLTGGRAITDRWLSGQLRVFGIQPRLVRIGDRVARGYCKEDFKEAFQRYISKADLEGLGGGGNADGEGTAPSEGLNQ